MSTADRRESTGDSVDSGSGYWIRRCPPPYSRTRHSRFELKHRWPSGLRRDLFHVCGGLKRALFAGIWAMAAMIVWAELGQPCRVMAQEESGGKIKELILPGETLFLDGRPAFILWPSEDKRRQPQPWVMYAPTLPGYPDSHERWMHEKFLDAGVAVAGIDMGEAYGSPAGTAGMTSLYTYLTEQRNFDRRPCLMGRSRGGLWVSSWAISHPQKVAGIIAIYPVFDLRTYPGLEPAAVAYEMTPSELAEQLPRLNPIERAKVLAENKIPMAIIHGDVDTVVPLRENSQRMAELYQAAGSEDLLHLEVVAGQGHNYWEGFFKSAALVDFAIRWATHESPQ